MFYFILTQGDEQYMESNELQQYFQKCIFRCFDTARW